MPTLQDLLKKADSYRQQELNITEETIKELHRLLYRTTDATQAGQYRTIPARIPNTEYLPPEPDEIPRLMGHLADQISSSRFTLHPIELAAMALKRLLDIHPFTEGNNRTALLLMNLILVNNGYGFVSIPPDRQGEYHQALSASRQRKDMEPISKLIAECVIESKQKETELSFT